MNIKSELIKLMKNNEILISDYDILNSINDEYLREIFYEKIQNTESTIEKKCIFIDQNSDELNLEKMLLYGFRNKKALLDAFEERIQQEEQMQKSNKNTLDIIMASKFTVGKLKENKIKEEKNLIKLKRLLKGIDICVATEYYNKTTNKPELEILDSKELITGKNISSRKNEEKLDVLFENLSHIKYEDLNGVDIFFNVIPINEIIGIFPNKEFNEIIFSYCINKYLWQKGKKSEKEIEEARENPMQVYKLYLENNVQDFLQKGVIPCITENLQYADIDKLVMCGAYRCYQGLESKNATKEDMVLIHQVLKELLKYCKNNKISENYKLEIQTDKEDLQRIEKVPYSYKDIEKCLNRFYKDRYISNSRISEIKEQVKRGEMPIACIPKEILEIVYNNDDYKKLLFLNEDIFKDIVNLKNLSNEEIVQEAEIQGLDSFEIINLLLNQNVITVEDLPKLFLNNKISKDTILKLCEEKIELKEISEQFMEYFAENYDPKNRENYIAQLENLYKAGIINIESIISWENEAIVARFLKDRVIDSTVVKQLMQDKTISIEYAQSLFGECILDPDMDNETRINLIKSKLISADYIGKAYQANLIPTSLADELTEAGYFEKSKYENISIDELQENSVYKLGDLRGLSKFRSDFGDGEGTLYPVNKTKNAMLIDPNAREDLFELLRAKRAVSTEMEPNDPFYNYEFYVLPTEKGEYGPNSVIIAERYYNNKDTMKSFATNNATYFFKWKDLLYMSNLKKSEVNKASKDIVFRANHVVSDGEDKEGSWGECVLTAIGKTMMGREIRKYSKGKAKIEALSRLEKIYSKEEWEDIQNKKIDIDVGVHSFKNPEKMYSHADGNR